MFQKIATTKTFIYFYYKTVKQQCGTRRICPNGNTQSEKPIVVMLLSLKVLNKTYIFDIIVNT